jgi:hypothetical protein
MNKRLFGVCALIALGVSAPASLAHRIFDASPAATETDLRAIWVAPAVIVTRLRSKTAPNATHDNETTARLNRQQVTPDAADQAKASAGATQSPASNRTG